MYRVNLERLLRQIRVWPIDPSTAKLYGVIHHDLKSRGRVLSQVDMMLAALARQMTLTVATSDQDFSHCQTSPPRRGWRSSRYPKSLAFQHNLAQLHCRLPTDYRLLPAVSHVEPPISPTA